jgi:D-glycero-beta-D-manno-heptose 1-phosphate adenylyltransferase
MEQNNNHLWSVIEGKIFTVDQLKKRIGIWKLRSNRVVFTNGCFDLLHPGHVRYLADAKSLGERLIIGVNADASVQKLKGTNRPIQNQQSRMEILASLHASDAIILFEEDTPELLIKALRPDILVKGGDWEPDKIIGADFVKSYGGTVLSIPFHEGFSTTKLEQKILNNK